MLSSLNMKHDDGASELKSSFHRIYGFGVSVGIGIVVGIGVSLGIVSVGISVKKIITFT